MRILIVGMLIACDAGTKAAPAPAPVPTPAPKITSAQQHVLDLFDPDIVGVLAPRAVDAGTYSIALSVVYEIFPTMEMRISGTRTASMKLELAADGKATACVVEQGIEGSEGQWHYEPPEKRTPYRSEKSQQTKAMTGSWSVVDGTTLIAFDAMNYTSCDASKAQPDQRRPMLRCIATPATKRIPVDAIACVETSPFVQLGMPMRHADRDPKTAGPPMGPPYGQTLVLARGGLTTRVDQTRTQLPSFTFSTEQAH